MSFLSLKYTHTVNREVPLNALSDLVNSKELILTIMSTHYSLQYFASLAIQYVPLFQLRMQVDICTHTNAQNFRKVVKGATPN